MYTNNKKNQNSNRKSTMVHARSKKKNADGLPITNRTYDMESHSISTVHRAHNQGNSGVQLFSKELDSGD